jgi:hypothetical protein
MFTANKLAIEVDEESGSQVWLGDLMPTGETQNYLCLGSDDEPDSNGLYLEFNDQINTCDGRGVQNIELRGARLVVRLAKGTPILGGTVSKLSEERLSQIEVHLDLDPKELDQLRETLRTVIGDSCPLVISEKG